MSDLYIVHCIDTEGPLYESLDETFARLKAIFGIELAATRENLRRLQAKLVPLDGLEQAVANLVAPARLAMNETWDGIDGMLDEICSDAYRTRLRDSEGVGWIYSWFCLDHVGFTGENPRRRTAGHHAVFDHYRRRNRLQGAKDTVQWHYHPLPIGGDFHQSGVSYLGSANVWQVLARKILDRRWFPGAFRPGFHTERPDSHWFLEQWIPFDYGNQAVKGLDTDQPDLAAGRYGDWRRAPAEWAPYHPAHDDYQVPGGCRRWITRCLNMEARLRELSGADVEDAFARAGSGRPSLLAFTNHDFRDMRPEIEKVRGYIEPAWKLHPDVKVHFTDAVTGFRRVLGLKPRRPALEARFERRIESASALLTVRASGPVFGPQPFLALRLWSGEYVWENFDFQGPGQWTYTFDANNLRPDAVERIGIAANSPEGIAEVLVIDTRSGELTHDVLHE